MDLSSTLVALIAEHPGQTARQLVALLRGGGYPTMQKSEVNRILYHQRAVFEATSEATPRWYLVGGPKTQASQDVYPPASVLAEISPKRLHDWQYEALVAWRRSGYRGVVEAVTGTGKTMIGIVAALEQLQRGENVLVLVPSIELLRQWQAALQHYAPEARIGLFGDRCDTNFADCDVLVTVVNSARVYDLVPRTADALLIADECHRYGSYHNRIALDERFPRWLGLSATYRRSDNGHVDSLDPYFGGTCFEMGYARAIADGVVAHFNVALIGVEIDGEERLEYDELTEKMKSTQTKLVRDWDVPADPFGAYMQHVQTLAKGGAGEATALARRYLSAFNKRHQLLAETPAKEAGLVKLVPSIRAASRVIIFTQTIVAAERAACVLGKHGILAAPVHSKQNGADRRQVLERFSSGELSVIIAPRVLDEGIDVPEADLAVILAASKTRRQMVQRMGRVLRRKSDARLARFALVYAADTSEDPERGAHGEFLEEIVDVADEQRSFDVEATGEEIGLFLNMLYSGSVRS